MNRKRKWEKEERREAITDVIRQNPCLTDEDLAKRFSVSAATIRLDRQMLGIPQMRKRIEKAVSEHPSGFHEELQILDMEKGKKGLALFHTTEEMTDRSGMVSADRLYAAAADFAVSLAAGLSVAGFTASVVAGLPSSRCLSARARTSGSGWMRQISRA